MNCKNIEDLLVLYIEKKLNKKDTGCVEQHLKECKNCNEVIANIKSASEMLEKLPPVKAPANFVNEVRSKIENLNEQPKFKWFQLPAFRLAPVFAVMLFAAYFVLNYNKPIQIPPTKSEPLVTKENSIVTNVKIIELAKNDNQEESPVVFRGAGQQYETKKFIREWKGLISGIKDARILIIKDNEQWAKIWKEHTKIAKTSEKPPEVDFNSEVAIAVFSGNKNSKCYGTEITKIEESANKYYLDVSEKMSVSSDAATKEQFQPYHIVIINKD